MARRTVVRGDGNQVGVEDLERESRELSSRVIKHLLAHGQTAQGLADTLGVGKSFISLVRSSQRSLRLEHLQLLERLVGMPLPLLLLQAQNSESLPAELRGLYEASLRAIKQSKSLRDQLLQPLS